MQNVLEIQDHLLKIRRNWFKSINRDYSKEYLRKLQSDLEVISEVLSRPILPADELVNGAVRENCRKVLKELRILVREKQEVKDGEDSEDSEDSEDREDSEDPRNEVKVSKDEEDSEDSEDRSSGLVEESKMSISFKDVEDSLEHFDGSGSVAKWLAKYEEVATAYAWSEVQKYLYCRRLLTRSARLAVEAEDDVGTFAKLKEFLRAEFVSEVKSASVHDELRTMRKKSEETLVEFAYRMKGIANRGGVDDLSLVQYVVGGIRDEWFQKSVLLEATSFAILRRKLEAYDQAKPAFERLAPRSQGRLPARESGPFSREVKTVKTERVDPRCFRCGNKDHQVRDCPNPVKCFSCQLSGHKSSECPSKPGSTIKTQSGRIPTVKVCKGFVLPDMHVVATVNEREVVALVDTGCDVTILARSEYQAMKKAPKLNKRNQLLASFGGHVQSTLGSMYARVTIGDGTYDLEVMIVDDQKMHGKMIIGLNMIKQASMTVRGGRVQLEPIKLGEDVESIGEKTFKDDENPFAVMNVVAMVKGFTVDVSAIHSAEVKRSVLKLTTEYRPERPQCSEVTMKLLLTDEEPVHRPPRRLAPLERSAVTTQIDEWLSDGIIRHSTSPYASPIVVVKKKDGTNRLCVDYRELNRKVIKDRYPLPLIEDVLENFHDARVFTTLDLRNGFFHVDVDEESSKYTAFVTPDGHYEFRKVPFGLCNSPAVFQRYVNTVFRDLIQQKVLVVYMDDLIIAAASEEENIKKVEKVFHVAQKSGLMFRFDKCQFLSRRVVFLGHILEAGTAQPSQEKTHAIRHFPEPKNVKQVQSFLGLAGFFRKFVAGFSVMARPLTDLTRKDRDFVFGAEARAAMGAIKKALCDEPVLKIYNPTLETELHADASKMGYGACLMQKHDDGWHPTFYLSSKTTPAEENYSSYELEVLAVIVALRKLRVYLLGLHFRIVTDCRAFKQTMTKRDLCARVARWALQLEEFDCEVVHRAGTAMRHVDAFSRFPTVLFVEGTVLEKVRRCQAADAECQMVEAVLKSGKKFRDYETKRGLLYRFIDGGYLLVVPKVMQHQLIRAVHENGHISARKTEALLKQEYAIDKLATKCERVIANCVPCILSSRKAGKQEGWLTPIPKSGAPLHTYHIDHLGPMASTAKNYKYLFVVVDSKFHLFIKFVWAIQ